jgi:hypothetical protein
MPTSRGQAERETSRKKVADYAILLAEKKRTSQRKIYHPE